MKKLILLICIPTQLFCQPLPDTVTKKIDSLFRKYSNTTPGCAIAIIKKDEVVYKKGYGMANLEFDIPITPSSIFHIASESKQYVAFCLLLLEQDGKLSLDDDIRKYLDYVPDFGKKITIKQLIHHTSGLRDQWQLLANAGWQLDDVITQEHVLKLVSKQKSLNFAPGAEFNYCNTGYTLMAEIVKKVSGLSLREYADKNIFQPLGMENTHFHDDYKEIVKNRTYSYQSRGQNWFENSVLSYSIVGATSLFTTVEDESRWLMNYDHGKVGGKKLVNRMYETGVLNNGKKLDYAFAISIDDYKGWKRIGHGGGDAGFRTYACRFPEQELGIIVFSNLGSFIPTIAAIQIADMLLPPKEMKPADNLPAADTVLLKMIQGKYFSETGNQLNLVWENQKLWSRSPVQTSGGNAWNPVVLEKGKYKTEQGLLLHIKDVNPQDSIKQLTVENTNGFIAYSRKPHVSANTNLSEFAGVYYNDETEARYSVLVRDNKLVIQHRKYDDAGLNSLVGDQFSCPYWWMNNIRFLRNGKGDVVAFEVNAGRIMHLRYEKIK